MTVISPLAAFTAPPETGASSISRSNPARAVAISCASALAIVEETITAVPGFRCCATPVSPNSTCLTWAALTTSTSRASSFSANVAALSETPQAPASFNVAQALLFRSAPQVERPARTHGSAAPIPIDPKPTRPT